MPTRQFSSAGPPFIPWRSCTFLSATLARQQHFDLMSHPGLTCQGLVNTRVTQTTARPVTITVLASLKIPAKPRTSPRNISFTVYSNSTRGLFGMMPPIYLLKSRTASSQRWHFAIFCQQTKIHVVGTPMTGYVHEIKTYEPLDDNIVLLGNTDAPMRQLIQTARQVPAPHKNEDFMAPVNDTTNKRCQEWTMEYLRALVKIGVITEDGLTIAQEERDSPTHGIGLRPIQLGE